MGIVKNTQFATWETEVVCDLFQKSVDKSRETMYNNHKQYV